MIAIQSFFIIYGGLLFNYLINGEVFRAIVGCFWGIMFINFFINFYNLKIASIMSFSLIIIFQIFFVKHIDIYNIGIAFSGLFIFIIFIYPNVENLEKNKKNNTIRLLELSISIILILASLLKFLL